jgi:hypothetical protein
VVVARGYTSAADAELSADLIVRRAGQPDQSLGTLSSTPQAPSFFLKAYISGVINIPEQTGDALVLHVTYLRGSAVFTVLETKLTIP